MALLAAPVAHAQLLPTFGRDRAGTAGFQFLKIPVDARSAALGETVVANAIDASALFWNPALAAQVEGHQLGFSHTDYFVDVDINYAAALYRGRGVGIGLSIQTLSAGDMDLTTEFQPTGTGETFGYADLALGLTVAQPLSDLFSYGVTAKYVQSSTAGLRASTMVADLGVFYRIGTTGAQMAVAIRNFGLDAAFDGELERIVLGEGTVVEDDFDSITPPTTFLLGVTYHLLRTRQDHALLLAGQLTNPNDNAESFNLGAEYVWNDVLMLRGGYRFAVEERTTPSAGMGLAIPGLGPSLRFDYGYTRMTRLGAVHRLGLDLGL